jgi:hypothetical protein
VVFHVHAREKVWTVGTALRRKRQGLVNGEDRSGQSCRGLVRSQDHPAEASLRVGARYPHSPWEWRDRTPDHVVQEDIVSNESLQVRSAPLYNAVVVTGELAGKSVTCRVRRAGEAGQLFAQQVSSPLINTSAVAAERGRNILADRGEQAAIDLVLPLFAGPLRPSLSVSARRRNGGWYSIPKGTMAPLILAA